MNRAISISILTLLLSILSYGQGTPKTAEESPLECAAYLISTDSRQTSLEYSDLIETYFELGKYDKALNFFEPDDARLLIYFTGKLISRGNISSANKFLDKAMLFVRESNYDTKFEYLLAENLIKVNRDEEAFELAEKTSNDKYNPLILNVIAETYITLNKKERALKVIEKAFNKYDNLSIEKRISIVQIYSKLNQYEKAKPLLENIEKDISKVKDTRESGQYLRALLPTYLYLGETEKAFEVLKNHKGVFAFRHLMDVSNTISSEKEFSKFKPFFQKAATLTEDQNTIFRDLVLIYAKFGEYETAFSLAKQMNSQSWQNIVLNNLTFDLIQNDQYEFAYEVLKFALSRTEKISYEVKAYSEFANYAEEKTQQLTIIVDYLLKIKRIKEAWNIIISLSNKLAKAEYLIKFAKYQINKLTSTRIKEILDQALSYYSSPNKDFNTNRIKLLVADAYAELGNRKNSIELIANVLKTKNLNNYYSDKILLLAGKIFERHNLKTNAKLRSSLRLFIREDNY